MKNTNVKNKLNKIKTMQIAETLAAVYIYIYIWGCHLVNKISKNKVENINRDRAMLKITNIGLSLCLFAKNCKKGRGFFAIFCKYGY